MPEWIDESREGRFPFLTRDLYEKTSDETPDYDYNCAAYVVGDFNHWWQPPDPDGADPKWYWPDGAPETGFVSSYVKAYELRGFELCGAEREEGFERIALYANKDGLFTHVALQLSDGKWTSKLGNWEDIQHDNLEVLEGEYPAFGFVIHFMRKPIKK